MSEVITGICGLGILLGLVTVLGHLLWLACAALFRLLAGEQPNLPRQSTIRCPECGERLISNQQGAGSPERCWACGYLLRNDGARTAPFQLNQGAELAATRRQLDRMLRSGAIARAEWEQLTALVRVEQERIQAAPLSTTNREVGRSFVPPPPDTAAVRPASPAADEAMELVEFVDEATPRPDRSKSPGLSEQAGFPPPLVAAPHRRQPLTGLLQAFMEEKNIRWGELISGMLIVISAVGLVISLWSTLADAVPYFPALLFMLLTAGIHGAGLYTLKRWKLKSTSRGLIVISTLLVPLNFLAAIALSEGKSGARGVGDLWYVVAVVVGLLGFGAITLSAARTLTRRNRWPLFVAVMGASASQLVLTWWTAPGLSIGMHNLLAALPVIAYLAGTLRQLQIAALSRRLSALRVRQTFLMFGLALFAVAAPLGLMVWKTHSVRPALAALSPALSLVSMMILALGLLVHRRATGPPPYANKNGVSTRTAGTWLALVGSSLLLACLALAWPRPELLVAVGLIDFAALTALAFLTALPVLHVGATAALGLVAVVGLHLWQGTLFFNSTRAIGRPQSGRDLLDVLLTGRSGSVLAVLSLLTGAAALLLWRRSIRTHAFGYLLSTAGLAAAATLVACYAGFVTGIDGWQATPVLALYAASLLAAGPPIRRQGATWLGSGLLLLTLLHALLRNPRLLELLHFSPQDPFVLAVLLHGSVAVALAGWWTWHRAGEGRIGPSPTFDEACVLPLAISALLTSVTAVPAVLLVDGMQFGLHAGYAFWLAAVWGGVACLHRSRSLWIAAQSLSTVAVVYGVTAVCQRQEWWTGQFYDPRHLQAQLAALGCWSIVWLFARQHSVRIPALQPMLEPHPLRPGIAADVPPLPATSTQSSGFSFDRVLLGATVLGVVALAMAGAYPGIRGEFVTGVDPHRSTVDLVHHSGAGWLTLLLIAVLSLVLFVSAAALLSARTVTMFVLLSLIGLWGLVSIAGEAHLGLFAPSTAPSHALAHGGGTWIALAIVVAGLTLSLREQLSPAALCGALLSAFAVPLLIAGRYEAHLATASALRWCLTAVALLLTLGVVFRERLVPAVRKLSWLPPASGAAPLHKQIRGSDLVRPLAVAIPAVPILALTLLYVLAIVDGTPPAAPLPGTFFAHVGPVWSYAGPVLAMSAILSLYAVRDRLPSYALAGSLALQLAFCLLFAVPRWVAGEPMTFPELAQLLEGCGLALGVYSLGWIIAMPAAERQATNFFAVHLTVNASVVLVPLAWASLAVFLLPDGLPASVAAIGSPMGYFALLCTAIALVLHFGERRPQAAEHAVMSSAAGLIALMAASLGDRSSAGNWLSYHALGVGWSLLAAGASLAACYVTYLARQWMTNFPEDDVSPDDGANRARVPLLHNTGLLVPPLRRWGMALGAVVFLFALRGEWSDPERPWWSAGMTGVIALSTAALAVRERRQTFAWLSVGYLLAAVSFVWLMPWIGIGAAAVPQSVVHLVEANLIALAVAGLAWLAVEVYWQRRWRSAFDLHAALPPVHHAAAIVGPVVAFGLVFICLVIQTAAIGRGEAATVDASDAGGWGMLAAIVALLLASLWDRRASYALPGLCGAGLLALMLYVDMNEPTPRLLLFELGMASAGYALVTALVARCDRQLAGVAARLEVPTEQFQVEQPLGWLTGLTCLLAAVAALVEFRVVLTFPELPLRLWGTAAAALLPLAVAARIRRHAPTRLRLAVLALAVVAAVDLGWAIMPFSAERQYWLPRSIRLMEVLAGATFVYGVIVARLLQSTAHRSRLPGGEWFRAVRLAASAAGGAAIASLLVVLFLEGVWFDPQAGPPVTGTEIAIVATVLVGLSAALISLAVLPGRDPLELSERGRMLYVYGAELVLSLLFLHIRFTMPELFRGLLLPYWPLVAMAIAYGGVGAGELFRQMRLRVLAEPLEKTGVFLPLLPAIGFWIHVSLAGPDVVRPEYSTVLFFAGLMYVLLSAWRKSFFYGAAAALAGNAALWALFYEQGVSLLTHPQMWMIPPALSVLLAAQLNRRRLSETQLAGIRYLAVMVIYVSSTADMFITGVGESLWLPMVLAALSVAGVFAGILLRVRAFLYLGTTFLFLSLVSMVWHAAQSIGRVWPWWAFGMLLGIAILALFGVFEKKRNEVLGVVRRLREWE